MKKPHFVSCPKCGKEVREGLAMRIHLDSYCEGKKTSDKFTYLDNDFTVTPPKKGE